MAGGTREGGDGALDLGRVAPIDWAYLNADRRRHGLNDGELPIPAAMVESRSTAARFTPGAIDVHYKSHRDPVTEADRVLNEVLREALVQDGEGWFSEDWFCVEPEGWFCAAESGARWVEESLSRELFCG